MDVKTAFLYGELKETIYMKLPEGYYHQERRQGKVCRLLKSIYGLKQAGRNWNRLLHEYMESLNFLRTILDCGCYIKRKGWKFIIVLIYVDDLMIFSTTQDMIIEFQDQIHSKFNMKTLGEVSYALGIKINIENNMVQLSQELYMHDIIARSGIKDMKPALSPMITSQKLHKKRNHAAKTSSIAPILVH